MFYFEPWPQLSTLSFWNVSFRQEVTSGSTLVRSANGLQTLIWQLVWKTWTIQDSYSTISWRKYNTKTYVPILAGRQIMFQIFGSPT